MKYSQIVPVSSVDQIRTQLIERLRCLLAGALTDPAWEDHLADILGLLAALPLATDEYGVASNRVRNARRYLTANERGAARFELQLLLGTIKSTADVSPMRRRFLGEPHLKTTLASESCV